MAQISPDFINPGVDLHLLKIIQAIGEEGTITGAARFLGYSQPAISQHLQRAESRLGISLIDRGGRRIKLTEAGLILRKHATPILDGLAEAAEALREMTELRAGRVGLVGFPSASSTIVPELLAVLKATRPGITLKYLEAEPPQAMALLKEGMFNLALVFSHPHYDIKGPEDGVPGFESVPLFVDEIVLVLPEDHPLAAESVVSLSSLESEQWIAGCPRCRRYLLGICQSEGFEPTISYETDNTVAVLGMVSRGLGVALLPHLVLEPTATPPGVVMRTIGIEPGAQRLIELMVPQPMAPMLPALATTISLMKGLDGSRWNLSSPLAAGAVSAALSA